MSLNHQSKAATLKRWQAIIKQWQNSGLSAPEFCKQQGFSDSGFYHWRKKILGDQRFGSVSHSSGSTSPFVQVKYPEPDIRLELELPSGVHLRFDPRVDRGCLTETLSVLKEIGLC